MLDAKQAFDLFEESLELIKKARDLQRQAVYHDCEVLANYLKGKTPYDCWIAPRTTIDSEDICIRVEFLYTDDDWGKTWDISYKLLYNDSCNFCINKSHPRIYDDFHPVKEFAKKYNPLKDFFVAGTKPS